jgi:hypothetical protein
MYGLIRNDIIAEMKMTSSVGDAVDALQQHLRGTVWKHINAQNQDKQEDQDHS